jgi:hypothetical protein
MPTAASPHRTARLGVARGALPRGLGQGGAPRKDSAGTKTGAWPGFMVVEEGVSDVFRQSPGPEIQ